MHALAEAVSWYYRETFVPHGCVRIPIPGETLAGSTREPMLGDGAASDIKAKDYRQAEPEVSVRTKKKTISHI